MDRDIKRANLKNIAVVLNEPRYPENIGAAARCCKNMGIDRLVCVKPRLLDKEKMLKMATHESAELIENLEVFDSLKECLEKFNMVIGTTARTGRQRRPTDTPRSIAKDIVRISQENKVALLFGSEKFGLTNDDLKLCHRLVTIPTAEFSSINLAQSVMILCYEIFVATSSIKTPCPKIASVKELEGMYEHLKEACLAIGFINPENPDYWMNNIRRLFARIELRSKEVRVIRGFCRQILWAVNKGAKKQQNKG